MPSSFAGVWSSSYDCAGALTALAAGAAASGTGATLSDQALPAVDADGAGAALDTAAVCATDREVDESVAGVALAGDTEAAAVLCAAGALTPLPAGAAASGTVTTLSDQALPAVDAGLAGAALDAAAVCATGREVDESAAGVAFAGDAEAADV